MFCPLQKVTSTSEPVPCHSTLYSPGARVVPACSVCEADDPEGVRDGSAVSATAVIAAPRDFTLGDGIELAKLVAGRIESAA